VVLIISVEASWAFGLDGLWLSAIVGLWMINPAQLRRSPVAERGKRQATAAYARRQPDCGSARHDGDRRRWPSTSGRDAAPRRRATAAQTPTVLF
jgi:hypothetical protein